MKNAERLSILTAISPKGKPAFIMKSSVLPERTLAALKRWIAPDERKTIIAVIFFSLTGENGIYN
jgi:hypothetical protein